MGCCPSSPERSKIYEQDTTAPPSHNAPVRDDLNRKVISSQPTHYAPARSEQNVQHTSSPLQHIDKKANKHKLQIQLRDAYSKIEEKENDLKSLTAKYNDWANQTKKQHTQDIKEAEQKIQQAADERNKTEEDRHKQEIQNVKRKLEQAENNLRREENRYLKDKDKLGTQIKQLQDEKDNLLSRLSAMAGAKLTDENPNIADLSDENRPTKIAEKYSEIYDNEWTDAFDILTKEDKMSEKDACQTLAEAFCDAYVLCKEKASADLDGAFRAMKEFYGYGQLPTEISKQLKDQRKKLFQRHKEVLMKKYKEKTPKLFRIGEEGKSEVNKFLQKCIEICWLMAIQDPQVFVDINLQKGREQLETDKYKPYTKTGQYIDYIVWPTLYLYEGGNILMKGVAQGTGEKDGSSVAQGTGEKDGSSVAHIPAEKQRESRGVEENKPMGKYEHDSAVTEISKRNKKSEENGTMENVSGSMETSTISTESSQSDSQIKGKTLGNARSTIIHVHSTPKIPDP